MYLHLLYTYTSRISLSLSNSLSPSHESLNISVLKSPFYSRWVTRVIISVSIERHLSLVKGRLGYTRTKELTDLSECDVPFLYIFHLLRLTHSSKCT